MGADNGRNVRGYAPAFTVWECQAMDCGRWVAVTDEHDRLVWKEGCPHTRPLRSSEGLRFLAEQGLVAGYVQGTLW